MFAGVGCINCKGVRRGCARTLVLSAVCVTAAGVAQSQSASLIGGDHVVHMVQQQKQEAAEARQKKMETDAARLVEMAQQLKTSVDKTNKDVLSVDVIRSAERIEKLAREVREGMRQ